MVFEQIRTGGDRNFGYLIADPETKEAAVVDPSGAPDLFLLRIQRLGLKLRWILCSHSHWDHTGGINELKQGTDALLAMHGSAPMPLDRPLEDSDTLNLGKLALQIIHTPGHCDDAICILINGNLMTGDTLYVGKIGGTTSDSDARKQYDSLHRKLMTLPEETKVYPGHDVGVRPSSTIGEEKRNNPFILQPDIQHFLHLKANWADYKKQHGIS
ncbi:MBL fold metallo-hydrolase [bacterium]|nr:MBL fold metallo-hydrolase [bacterium]RQV97907.1 MAG: MBL fold metallo-hydrolase [bacterium]